MEFEKLQKIIAEVLNIDTDKITMESTFVDDLGADSLDVFQIIMGRKKVIRKPEKHILIVLWDFSVEIHWEMNLSHQLITV